MPSKDTFIAVLLPAYNEAVALPALLDSLRGLYVIVVDDGSTDGTGNIVCQNGAVVLVHDVRQGKGVAMRTGFRHIRSMGILPDAVIIMDADGQHTREDVEALLSCWRHTHADIVLGVRDLRLLAMPLLRRWWNRFITALISFGTGSYFSDSQCGIKLISRHIFQEDFLKQNGYCIESGILFWATRQRKNIVEYPVMIRYNKIARDGIGEVRRACLIFFFVLQMMSKNVFGRFFLVLKREWNLVRMAFLFFLATLLLYQFIGSMDVLNNVAHDSTNMELEAALAWLKKNSDKDAIVLSHRILGHQIVAFADRRVVLTTKVYPTEFAESARRYRDIGQFFFASDEETALKIAKTYNASYIFVNKNFSPDFCKGIGRCDLVIEKNKLAPWAYNVTMAGLMIQGAHFTHFKKVWDSSRFVIYKITDEERELSLRAKKTAVTIARKTLEGVLYDGEIRRPEDFHLLLETEGLRELL